ncbi:acyl-CoA carboxylase biotin carboxyl carrier protein subunit, partial [Achromobacter xylosoxidans]
AQSAPQAAAPADPWDTRDGWRLGGRYQRALQWIDNGETRHVTVTRQGADWTLDGGDGARPFAWRAENVNGPARVLRITLDGRERAGTVVLHADKAHVFGDGGARVLDLYDPLAHAQDTQGDHGGGLTAPMPGKIISIAVKAGDSVTKGQPLLVMEAMKMEHTISAPADGKVEELFYAVGDQVTEGAELVAIGA